MTSRDGLILVDKEAELTSHDVVEIARRRTRIRKIGHTGTLDPLATGLLILCVGRATRLQALLMNMEKTYEGTIQFGWATDSYDSSGTTVGEPVDADLSGIDLSSHAEKFKGEIDQIPPRFSAKKIAGVRAYELARRGEAPEMTPKRVKVSVFTIEPVTRSVAKFLVRCSAGTYVRSLAHDLGAEIGLGGHLQSLRRLSIGRYEVSAAISSQAMSEARPEEILRPPHYQGIDSLELPLENVLIDRIQEGKMLRGESVVLKPASDTLNASDLVTVRNPDDQLVAIAVVERLIRGSGGPVSLQPKVVLRNGAG